ncbi:MAG: hypothetical protein U0326_22560 [Polyangiales bacterium]
MNRSSSWVILTALIASTAACGDSTGGGGGTPTDDVTTPTDTTMPSDVTTPMDRTTPTDNPQPTDVVRTDGGNDTGSDVTMTDAPRTDAAVDAGPPYDPCAASAVVDLTARGTVMGNVLRYTGNNNMVGAMAPLTASCTRNTGHQVVLRYTPRTNARLRISTNNMGTDATFDTVVWAQASCTAATGDAGAPSLGCNDDNGAMPRTSASTFTTTAAGMMGTPIFIIVAGYTPALSGRTEQGAFELTVTEISTVAVGATCDPTGATNACATGSTCVTASGASTCVADGARGGACRTAMGSTPCDTGLACSAGTCQTSIAVGMPCGTGVTGVCATGSSCVTSMGMSRCTADGAAGARCRTGTGVMACDTGLTCTLGTCLSSIPVGMPCGSGVTGACVMGSTCVGVTGAQRCTADGAAGAHCRTGTGVMPCDAGLTCSGTTSGTCYRVIAAGMPCSPTDPTQDCAANSVCVGLPGMERCVADGAPGGDCRAMAPQCDTGLTCNAIDVCTRVVPAGMACNDLDPAQECAMNTTCAPMGTGTTCQMDSTAAGTFCNDMAPLCGTGLTCDGTDSNGVCRSAGTMGGACNLGFNSVACPMNTACLATSLTAATCAATRAETEPNNSAAMPQAAISTGTAFSGAVGGTDAMDCFAVTVPANGSVVAATETPGHPRCSGNDTVVTLYNSAGAQVARNDDDPSGRRGLCSYLSARTLPAGTYSLCIAPYSSSTMIASYTLTIGVFGP